MKRLDQEDVGAVLGQLEKNRMMNLFMIRCLEDFSLGTESELYSLAGGFLLVFKGILAHIVLEDDAPMDRELENFLSAHDLRSVMGRSRTLERLADILPDWKRDSHILLGIDTAGCVASGSLAERLSSYSDYRSLLELYRSIDEYRADHRRRDDEAFIEERLSYDSSPQGHDHFTVGLRKDGEIVSAATLNGFMVVNVCTHRKYRRRGYATMVMQKLLDEVIMDGTGRDLVLLADTPEAVRMYKHLGFKCVGSFSVMRPQQGGKHALRQIHP